MSSGRVKFNLQANQKSKIRYDDFYICEPLAVRPRDLPAIITDAIPSQESTTTLPAKRANHRTPFRFTHARKSSRWLESLGCDAAGCSLSDRPLGSMSLTSLCERFDWLSSCRPSASRCPACSPSLTECDAWLSFTLISARDSGVPFVSVESDASLAPVRCAPAMEDAEWLG